MPFGELSIDLTNTIRKIEELKSAIGDPESSGTLIYHIEKLNKTLLKQLGGVAYYTYSVKSSSNDLAWHKNATFSVKLKKLYVSYMQTVDYPTSTPCYWIAVVDPISGAYNSLGCFETNLSKVSDTMGLTADYKEENEKLYVVFYDSDNTKYHLRIYSINSDGSLTLDEEKTLAFSDITGNTNYISPGDPIGAVYFNGKLYVIAGEFGTIEWDVENNTASVLYGQLISGTDGEYIYYYDWDDTIERKKDYYTLVNTYTFKQQPNVEKMLFAFAPDDTMYVIIKFTTITTPFIYKYTLSQKPPKWFVNSTRTTDDIYDKLSSIGGNISVTNFPAWFTSSTKKTDDIVTTITTQIDTKTSVIDSRLYNSTDGKSVYDHLKAIATNTDITLSTIKTAIEGQQPRKMYGYDGTNWVAIKTTTDGKVYCVFG